MYGRRLVMLPLLGLAHLAILGVALVPGSSATATPPAAMTVVAVAVPPQPSPAAVPVVDLAVATEVTAPVVEIAAPAVASSGCAMGETIQAAIEVDDAARAALAQLPPGSRSVANVVTLWDGGWRATGDAAWRTPVRRAVAASILAAPDDCRGAAVMGPRLLYVADAGRTLILAVGSGAWKWNDLLG